MTATIDTKTTIDHPLTPLSADEIRAARRIVDAHGLLGDSVRFVFVALEEPHKSEVLAFRPGDAMDRRARVLLLDRATGQGSDLVVSVTEGRVVSETAIDSTRDGHVPILDQEFEDIESFLLDCPEWIEAMTKRKLNPTDVRAVPLSAGYSATKTRWAGASSACWRSTSTTPRICRGRTRSTASSPTSTSRVARS